VWMAAAVGVTLGIGRYGLGVATTIGVLAAIRLLMPLSSLLARSGVDAELRLRCPADGLREVAIVAYLRGFEVENLRCECDGAEAEISFGYRSRDPRTAAMLDGLRERVAR